MFFGSVPFGATAFGDLGAESTNITISATGFNLTATLSNAYTVQKTHFVNGFSLSTAVNSAAAQISPTPAGNNATIALNSPVVVADGTIHLPANSLGMTVTLSAVTEEVAEIVSGVNLTSAVTGSGATTNYTVTVVNSGGNKFAINGVVAPALTLVKGQTYVFNVSDPTNNNHPFRILNTNGVQWTDGVAINNTAGSSGATVTFTVPRNAPKNLAYYCTVHGTGMGNTITLDGINIQLDPVAALAGQSLSSAVNDVVAFSAVPVSGQTITAAVNNIQSVTGTALATPSTTSATLSVNSAEASLNPVITGTSSSLSVNSISLGFAPTIIGNSLTTASGGVSVFTFTDVDDTTTATISLTSVSTAGAGTILSNEVSTAGAGEIEQQEVA
jgi:hypothetical protein